MECPRVLELTATVKTSAISVSRKPLSYNTVPGHKIHDDIRVFVKL